MKIKENFIVRNVAGENLVVPLAGSGVDFNSVITLNESGKFLWDILEKGSDYASLLGALVAEYGIDEATAKADIDKFIASLKENKILEEEK